MVRQVVAAGDGWRQNTRPADTRLSKEVDRTMDEQGYYWLFVLSGFQYLFDIIQGELMAPCHGALLTSLHNIKLIAGGAVVVKI